MCTCFRPWMSVLPPPPCPVHSRYGCICGNCPHNTAILTGTHVVMT